MALSNPKFQGSLEVLAIQAQNLSLQQRGPQAENFISSNISTMVYLVTIAGVINSKWVKGQSSNLVGSACRNIAI